MTNSGLAVGLTKGHVVTKKEKSVRPAAGKGVSTAYLSNTREEAGG